MPTIRLGDTDVLPPLVLMYTLGRKLHSASIHAGGLRYHGDSPLVSQPYHEGLIEAVRGPQRTKLEAGIFRPRQMGISRARKQPRISRRYRRSSRMQSQGSNKDDHFTLSGVTGISTWLITLGNFAGSRRYCADPDEVSRPP